VKEIHSIHVFSCWGPNGQ